MPHDRGRGRRPAAFGDRQGEQRSPAGGRRGDLALSARVILVGKPGCHLCDVAREVVETVCADTDTEWVEVSLDDDPRLAARYTDQVPVVLVDGQVHEVFRVNPQRLRAALGG